MRKAAIINWAVYRLAGWNRQRTKTFRWRVGIYQPGRLGDFVLSLGAIRRIIDQVGEEHCVLFCSPVARQLVALEFPRLHRVELPELDGKLWVTQRNLQSPAFAAAVAPGVEQLICLRHYRALFDELALQRIPAQQVWCVENSPLYHLDYELVRARYAGDVTIPRPPAQTDALDCEDLRCHQALLSAWLGQEISRDAVLSRMNYPGAGAGNYLAISPFGSEPIRDLPVGAMCAGIRLAVAQWGLEARLLAPPREEARYQHLARQLQAAGAPVSVMVTADIPALVQALAASAMVLTTETATAHLATALNRPMVCLLGGGHYGCFAPWAVSRRQTWVSHPMDCYHCHWECRHPEPYCITGITPDRLMQAMQTIWNTTTPSR